MITELKILFARELASWETEITLFPDDASVWKTVPGLPNSAGTLTLHICGNLRHFVGATLGGTGYVRTRDVEFADRDIPRAVLIAGLQQTLHDVVSTLDRLDEKTLGNPFPIVVGKDVHTRTDLFLMHLASHLAYHLGQVDYARRAVTGDPTSAGTLPLQPLAR